MSYFIFEGHHTAASLHVFLLIAEMGDFAYNNPIKNVQTMPNVVK
jgi:hypothetical protein